MAPPVGPALNPNLDVIGDRSAETWPSYVRDSIYLALIKEVIHHCDFIVRDFTKDGMVFMVGEYSRSRLMGVSMNDPHGLVYVFEDDGKPFDAGTFRQFKPTAVYTLGEFVKEGYRGVVRNLELDTHQNRRLWPKN